MLSIIRRIKGKKRLLSTILLFVSIGLLVIVYFLVPYMNKMEFSDDNVLVYPYEAFSIKTNNVEFSGGEYIPIAKDPQLEIWYDKSYFTNSLLVEFASPITEEYAVQVFYAGANEYFAEERSRRGVLLNGEKTYTCEIPAYECEKIRIDIDGKVKISEIRISPHPLIKSPTSTAYIIHVLRLIAIALIVVTIILNIPVGGVQREERINKEFKNASYRSDESFSCLSCDF